MVYLYEPSDVVIERMKSERARLTPARAMLLMMLADLTKNGEFASVFAAEKLVYFIQRLGTADIFKVDFLLNNVPVFITGGKPMITKC